MNKLILPLASKRDHTAMKMQENQLLENLQKSLINDDEGELIIKRLKDLQYQVHLDVKHIIDIQPMERIMNQEECEELKTLQIRSDVLSEIKLQKQMKFIQTYEQFKQKKLDLVKSLEQEVRDLVAQNEEQLTKTMQAPIGDQVCLDANYHETTVGDQFETFYEDVCKVFVKEDIESQKEVDHYQKLIQLKMNQNKQLMDKLKHLRRCQQASKNAN